MLAEAAVVCAVPCAVAPFLECSACSLASYGLRLPNSCCCRLHALSCSHCLLFSCTFFLLCLSQDAPFFVEKLQIRMLPCVVRICCGLSATALLHCCQQQMCDTAGKLLFLEGADAWALHASGLRNTRQPRIARVL